MFRKEGAAYFVGLGHQITDKIKIFDKRLLIHLVHFLEGGCHLIFTTGKRVLLGAVEAADVEFAVGAFILF